MPHATHFLSRLERLTPSQVDLAMTLYRAPAILRVFAEVLQIPADSRLAFALDESASPPHLVLSGDGGFITCLGPGMSTAQLPVIPFEVLDAAMTRYKHLLLADDLVGETGRGFMLHRRMLEPDQLSREAFVGIGAYYDPLVHELRASMQTFMKTAREYTERAAAGQTAPALLELWWTSINASGHGAMLIARACPTLAAEDIDEVLDVAIRSGHLATIARGLWASLQVGQARWSSCLKHLGGGPSFNTLVRCALEVTVHALADTSLRNVTRRALSEASSLLTAQTCLAAPAVCSMLLAVLDAPDVHQELFRMASAQLCVVLGERTSATSDFHFSSGDAVPRSLLGAGLVLLPQTIHESAGWTTLMTALPFIAQADAHDLYPPADALRAWGLEQYRPKAAEHLARAVREHRPRAQPRVNTAPRTSRNAPCACGSGMKRKHCCADGLAAAA